MPGIKHTAEKNMLHHWIAASFLQLACIMLTNLNMLRFKRTVNWIG